MPDRYPVVMIARATIALDATDVPRHQLDKDKLERAEISGEGASWEDAKAAALAQLPPNALVLAMFRE